jgi:hypothetical protein
MLIHKYQDFDSAGKKVVRKQAYFVDHDPSPIPPRREVRRYFAVLYQICTVLKFRLAEFRG